MKQDGHQDGCHNAMLRIRKNSVNPLNVLKLLTPISIQHGCQDGKKVNDHNKSAGHFIINCAFIATLLCECANK